MEFIWQIQPPAVGGNRQDNHMPLKTEPPAKKTELFEKFLGGGGSGGAMFRGYRVINNITDTHICAITPQSLISGSSNKRLCGFIA